MIGTNTRTTRGIGPPQSEEGLSCDEAFEILSNRRRRFTLDCLAESGEPVDLRTLSTSVAARENETDVEAVNAQQRKRTYTALRQTHLPKMDDLGIVNFNAARGIIEPTDRIDQLESYLEQITTPNMPRGEFYLALTIVVALFVGATTMGVVSTAWFTNSDVVYFGLGIVFVASLFDVGYTRVFSHRRRRCRGEPW